MFMYGGPGDDTIEALTYPNTHAYAILTGDDGMDRITTSVHSAMYGGANHDTLLADGSNDSVIAVGDGGNDIIQGSAFADWIWGGDGDDSLQGNSGADYYNCGPGYDTIIGFDISAGDVKTADCEAY